MVTLGNLIEALEAEPDPGKVVRLGFTNPHSWRGNYTEVAFEPAHNVTVASMLEAARSAVGSTYQGWRGGDFTMGPYTGVYLAVEGTVGEELGPTLLRYMLSDVVDGDG